MILLTTVVYIYVVIFSSDMKCLQQLISFLNMLIYCVVYVFVSVLSIGTIVF